VSVVSLDRVGKTYRLGGADVPALVDVSLEVAEGEYVAVVGPSGSGKSTLLHVLGCLTRPTCGTYRLDGRDVSGLDDDEQSRLRSRRLGFVFQGYDLVPQLDVLGNVALPLLYAGRPEAEARARACVLATRLGLGDRLRHRPAQLSGGQQQRTALARALANDPRLLLADEPTGNLDRATGAEVLDLFDEIRRDGRTLVVVTHDPSVAARADRVVHVLDGRVDRMERRCA
jgi:putative ABC transport system ATP-binding protein